MKRLSHIMVTLSTLVLLLFGSGGIGWQRCACTGRVSLVLPATHSCCKSGSKCMTVTVKHLSDATLQSDQTALSHAPALDMARCLPPFSEFQSISYSQHILPQPGHAYWYPPGWAGSQGMVMRV